ncbi:MAG: hypothetical protein ABMA64_16090 [Myxococcota bacterium]
MFVWWLACAPADPESAPVLDEVGEQVREELADVRVRKVRLDGGIPDGVLPGPLEAALAFGGLVALGGGVLALALWRRG